MVRSESARMDGLKIDVVNYQNSIMGLNETYERLSGFALDHYCINSTRKYLSDKILLTTGVHKDFIIFGQDVLGAKNPRKKMTRLLEEKWGDIRISEISKLSGRVKASKTDVLGSARKKTIFEIMSIAPLITLIILNLSSCLKTRKPL